MEPIEQMSDVIHINEKFARKLRGFGEAFFTQKGEDGEELELKFKYLYEISINLVRGASEEEVGRIFCKAILDSVWRDSIGIAEEIYVDQSLVDRAIGKYKASVSVDRLCKEVSELKRSHTGLPVGMIRECVEILMASGQCKSVSAAARKLKLKPAEVREAMTGDLLPIAIIDCYRDPFVIGYDDIKRIRALAQTEGWETLLMRAAEYLKGEPREKLTRPSVIRLLKYGKV